MINLIFTGKDNKPILHVSNVLEITPCANHVTLRFADDRLVSIFYYQYNKIYTDAKCLCDYCDNRDTDSYGQYCMLTTDCPLARGGIDREGA